MVNIVDHDRRSIYLMALENNNAAASIYIANVHSIVISTFFITVLVDSTLFSDILDSLFVHTFVVVYFLRVYT